MPPQDWLGHEQRSAPQHITAEPIAKPAPTPRPPKSPRAVKAPALGIRGLAPLTCLCPAVHCAFPGASHQEE